jgi:hypothetical protein
LLCVPLSAFGTCIKSFSVCISDPCQVRPLLKLLWMPLSAIRTCVKSTLIKLLCMPLSAFGTCIKSFLVCIWDPCQVRPLLRLPWMPLSAIGTCIKSASCLYLGPVTSPSSLGCCKWSCLPVVSVKHTLLMLLWTPLSAWGPGVAA